MQSFVQARNKADAPGVTDHNVDEGLESLKVVWQKKQPTDRAEKPPQDTVNGRNNSIEGAIRADRGRFDSPPSRPVFNQNSATVDTHIAGQDVTRQPVLQETLNANRPQSIWSTQWHNDQDPTHDRLESVKRRKVLAIETGGLATSYIKGDSYADTTSGRLTDQATQDIQSQGVSHAWQTTTTPYHQQTNVRPSIENEALLPAAQIRRTDRPPMSHIYQPHIDIDDGLASLEQLLPPFMEQPLSGQNRDTIRHALQENQHAEYADQVSSQTALIQTKAQPAKSGVTFDIAKVNKPGKCAERTEHSIPEREQTIPQSKTPSIRLQASDVDSRLFAMDYSTLQAQSFDEEPSEHIDEAPTSESFKTLHRVDELLILEEDDRMNELKSLSIDAWEDIGSQLVQRFGDAFTKLTQIRRERRKAALSIEAELDARHLFVTKKRKTTENGLVEMRSNGSQVLLKTPRKV